MRFVLILLSLSPAASQSTTVASSSCPAGCYCDERRLSEEAGEAGSGGIGVRVNCHPLASGSLDLSSLPENVVHLDLARYGLQEITEDAFQRAPYLKKLDLQNNEISHVEEGAFASLSRLEVLDLSMNNLEVVTTGMFAGLEKLVKLKLNDNRIQAIEKSALDGLLSLHKLELAENPFICDCNLSWFVRWLQSSTSSAVLSNSLRTRCALPIALADRPLKNVDADEMTCGQNLEVVESHNGVGVNGLGESGSGDTVVVAARPPSRDFRLNIAHNQVAFEGDSVTLICTLDGTTGDQKLQWLVRGKPLEAQLDSNMTVSTVRRGSAVESTLVASSVKAFHSGEWTCLIDSDTSGREIMHRSVNILVISESTRLCKPKETKTSRGLYKWGSAIGGRTLQQHCQKTKDDSDRLALAYFHCRENGLWSSNVNASLCGYTSKMTDTLHKFASMKTTFTLQTLLSSAKHFLNFTRDAGRDFNDPMDVVFFARAVENYLPYLPGGRDLGHYLLSMVENVMSVEPELLSQAQTEDLSSQKLLWVVSNVTLIVPNFQHHTNKLAVESYVMHPTSFGGVTCSWYVSFRGSTGASGIQHGSGVGTTNGYGRREPRHRGRVFHCGDYAPTISISSAAVNSGGKSALASVTLPKSLYRQMAKLSDRELASVPLVFGAFTNASLFPITLPTSPDYLSAQDVVIGVSTVFGREVVGNLSDPVNIVIRTDSAVAYDSRSVQPVWWDQDSNNGLGSWRPESCELLSAKAGIIWFTCNRLGFYSYELLKASLRGGAEGQPRFRFHHPLIYIGASVCLVLLMSSIIMYSSSFHGIFMSRQLKHSLLNMWTTLAALVFFFVTGIYQVEHVPTCRLVGFVTHYLTLSHLFWMTVSMNVILQRASKHKQRQTRSQAGGAFLLSGSDVQQQPQSLKNSRPSIARLYVLGWGASAVAVLACGAIDPSHYGGTNNCFMQIAPFLGAVVLPGAVLTALMVGFGFSAWCIASASPSHITERIEFDVLPPHHLLQRHGTSLTSLTTGPQPDQEKTSKSLLLAHAYIFVLFLSAWMCAALSVVEEAKTLPHQHLIFSALFAVSAISLGVFIFVYFCASRQDVQECWRRRMNPNAQDATDHCSETSNLVNVYPGAQFDRHEQQHPFAVNPNAEGKQGLIDGYSSASFHITQPPDAIAIATTINSSRNCTARRKEVPASNDYHKDSDASSDRLSLNNVNHLRRGGYVAPVNSDADYGAIYNPVHFGGMAPTAPVPGGEKMMYGYNGSGHRDMKRDQQQQQPKTSSPAGSQAVPFNQDITVSPLVAESVPKTSVVEDPLDDSIQREDPDYTESSTIRMGAPDQMASFGDFPSASSDLRSRVLPARGKPPASAAVTSSLGRHKRRFRSAVPLPSERVQGDEEEGADEEEDDTGSKVSGVSSNFSSRSSRSKGKKHHHKKPNRRRQRVPEKDAARRRARNFDEDDSEDETQQRLKPSLEKKAEEDSEQQAPVENQTAGEEKDPDPDLDVNLDPSQSDGPTRETSV